PPDPTPFPYTTLFRSRLEDPPRRARRPHRAEGGDVGDVGILRIDPDLGDLPGLDQAHVGPGLPGIGGLVDPVAMRDVAADRELRSEEHTSELQSLAYL